MVAVSEQQNEWIIVETSLENGKTHPTSSCLLSRQFWLFLTPWCRKILASDACSASQVLLYGSNVASPEEELVHAQDAM
eukprot:590050-Amphidinium_carterae.1